MRSKASVPASIAILLLVLSPAPARSQQGTAPTIPAPRVPAAPPAGCPVRYSALHYGLSATLRETAGGPVTQYAQSLRLLFDPAVARTITRIVGLVHGRDGSVEMLPLQMRSPRNPQASSADRTEPFEFHRQGSQDAGLDGVQYLYTNSIPLITRIEITEIDFMDGSVWAKSPLSACSIAPSPFVLVNASAQ